MDAATLDFLAVAITTLFVVIDPLGVAPVFATLTEGKNRTAVAVKACLYSFLILALFVFAGTDLLEAVGISMPAFRAAGGVLLFLIGLEMVFEKRQERRSKRAEEGQEEAEDHGDGDDVAIFPLALPLLAGPGSITSVVLLSSSGGLSANLWTLLSVAVVLVISVIILAGGGHLLALAGRTTTMALSRLLGVLVCALSVQYVLDGVIAAMSGAAG